jgi:hypothetical protein
MGYSAGLTGQKEKSVAIGLNSGCNNQSPQCVALGADAGKDSQQQNAIAIGVSAGNLSQGIDSIGIGLTAGYGYQGQDSIAIGTRAGFYYQNNTTVAIGAYAGSSGQKVSAVSIGEYSGECNQGQYSVAIGGFAARTNQGDESIAIGYIAGRQTQGNQAIAIGKLAGGIQQKDKCVAIGDEAGYDNQGTSSIAIGQSAGRNGQQSNAVAIGKDAGNTDQSSNSIAIGFQAGNFYQCNNSVAIGSASAQFSQGSNSIAIGSNAGNSDQKEFTVAIGSSAGEINQGTNAIAIGTLAGMTNQQEQSTAIGLGAGTTKLGLGAVAIGAGAGGENAKDYSVSIGAQAGYSNAGVSSVSIGDNAGNSSKGDYSVAVGYYAAQNFQGSGAIAIGKEAGQFFQKVNAIAIGELAGQNNQGTNSIAIGANAGFDNQSANSIIINGNSNILNADTSGFFVNPVRNIASSQLLQYNTTNSEILYSNRFNNDLEISGNLFVSGDISGINRNTFITDISANDGTTYYPTFVDGSGNKPFYINSSNTLVYKNQRLGIGKSSPTSTLDVSGTANITGNLSVDTNTLFVDASNNRVGVGTTNTNPFSKLTVNSDDSTAAISINRYNKDGPAYLYFRATDGSEGIPTSVTGGRTIGNINFAAYDGSKFIGSVATIAANVDSGSVGSTNMPGNLRFYTRPINDVSDTSTALNSFERMRILSNGNVGVGTTTPTSTLDVSGTANITGNFTVDTNTLFVDASNNRVGVGLTTPANTLDVRGITRITNDDGNSMLYVNSVNPTGISATILNALVNSGAGYGELQTRGSIQTFYTTTNERMRITNSGDVGIGTITPETRLDVVGNSIQCSNQGRFKGWYSGGAGSGLATEIGTLSGEGYINTYDRTAGTYGPLNLVSGSSANIKLLTNGNVGIGTITPNYKLQVEGSGTANEIVGWFNNQGAFSSSIAVRQASKTAFLTNHSGSGTPNYDGQLSNAISFGVSSGASPIQFWNGNTGVGLRGTAKMTILENGNVGIGTNAPAYPLDVSGSAKFTTIRDSANLTGTSGQVLSSTGSALSWIGPLGYAIIRHVVSSGSGPGVSFTISPTPTRTTRTLNSLVAGDNNLGVTLASNVVTIPTTGTYIFRARACFAYSQLSGTLQYSRVGSKLMIALTSGTPDPNWIVGESYVGGFNPTALSQFSPSYWLECNGVKTVTANTTITLTQICRGLDITTLNVLGGASTFVDSIPELYASLEIQRIA